MSSLVLGTVQLGMRYGVANKTGQPDQKMAIEIVRAAWAGGIREFDTAQEYGGSERVLGVAFHELGITDKVRVISKLRKDIDLEDDEAVVRAVKESITRLGVPKLYGLLLHKEELLDEWPKYNMASEFIHHIGVSVYNPKRALQALEMDGIDIIQIPANILDRRFEKARVLARAKERSVEIFVRSVFLQGLLLMDLKKLPAHMEFARPVVERIDILAREIGVTRQVLALQYIKTAFPDAHVVLGVETVEQVRENVAVWNTEAPTGIIERIQGVFNDVDEMALDPRRWPILQLQQLVASQKPEKSDAIVWLQGNGYDRGAKVLELYRAGFAPHIVITGNNVRRVEDDVVKVSDIIQWLQEHGIDRTVIICDEQSMHTLDQARRAVAMAKEHNWQKILLVGSTHHQLRAFLTFLHCAKQIGWNGRIINQPAHIDWDAKPSGRRKTAREAFKEELEKLEKYKENIATTKEGIEYLSREK